MPLSVNEVSFNSSTIYSLPQNITLEPADLEEENKNRFSIGKFLSSNTFKNVLPTIPVAPTIATFTFFI